MIISNFSAQDFVCDYSDKHETRLKFCNFTKMKQCLHNTLPSEYATNIAQAAEVLHAIVTDFGAIPTTEELTFVRQDLNKIIASMMKLKHDKRHNNIYAVLEHFFKKLVDLLFMAKAAEGATTGPLKLDFRFLLGNYREEGCAKTRQEPIFKNS